LPYPTILTEGQVWGGDSLCVRLLTLCTAFIGKIKIIIKYAEFVSK